MQNKTTQLAVTHSPWSFAQEQHAQEYFWWLSDQVRTLLFLQEVWEPTDKLYILCYEYLDMFKYPNLIVL